MKNDIFLDVTPCGCCKNRRFRGTYRLHRQNDKNQRARNVSSNCADVVPSSLILVTLIMDATHSTETSVLTRATRRHIPEGGVLHSLSLSLELLHTCCSIGDWLTD
jgi:hypothetical protein